MSYNPLVAKRYNEILLRNLRKKKRQRKKTTETSNDLYESQVYYDKAKKSGSNRPQTMIIICMTF